VTDRTLPFPSHLFRRFGTPAACTALVTLAASVLSFLFRRPWRPRLPRMSDAWLRSHDLEFDRYDPWREY